MSATEDVGVARMAVVDVGVRSLLIGEARRRAVTRVFGVPADEQSLLVTHDPARRGGRGRPRLRAGPTPPVPHGRRGGRHGGEHGAAGHCGSAICDRATRGRPDRVRAAVAFAAPHGGRSRPRGPRAGARNRVGVRRSLPALIRPGAGHPVHPDRCSGSQGPVVLAVDEDAVDDVDAQEEDRQRPPRVGAADREQRPDRAEAGADDPDDPAVGVAGHQREASGELDHPEDDQHPAQGVEVGEDVALVVDEDVRVVQGADAVDDVERAHDHQQRCCEQGSTGAAHPYLLGLTCPIRDARRRSRITLIGRIG